MSWGPPKGAIAEAVAHAHEPLYSAYGPDEGLPELRGALQRKIEQENGLQGVGSASMLRATERKFLVVARRTHAWLQSRQHCWRALQTRSTHKVIVLYEESPPMYSAYIDPSSHHVRFVPANHERVQHHGVALLLNRGSRLCTRDTEAGVHCMDYCLRKAA